MNSQNICYLDFVNSYCLFEFCIDKGFLKPQGDENDDLGGLRHIARTQKIDNVLPFLFLFDTICINDGSIYSSYIDLYPLFKSGFFTGYKPQYTQNFIEFYRLIKPLAIQTIRELLITISPTNVLLQKNPIFDSYFDILLDTVYDIEASFAVGKTYSGLDPYSILPEEPRYFSIVGLVTNLMEALIKPQAHLLNIGAPVLSSMFPNMRKFEQAIVNFDVNKRGLFGLYLEKVEGITGLVPRVESMEDFLRLREDKRFEKVRSLLTRYLLTCNTDKNQIADEIEKEVIAAKRSIDRWHFLEKPFYIFTVKPLSYIPVIGNLISVVDDALDLAALWAKRASDWIYLGMK